MWVRLPCIDATGVKHALQPTERSAPQAGLKIGLKTTCATTVPSSWVIAQVF